MRIRKAWPILVAALCFVTSASAAPLKPAVHGTFRHYTFALTWQPGICGTDEGCTADQPHDVLIGLHGLWASRPHSLTAAGVVRRQWWSHGCGYFRNSTAAPPISPALTQRLNAVMPHFRESLLTHEYDKHVQCFGFDPTTFFTTELRMRDAVVSSAFGHFLVHHVGSEVTHSKVVQAFRAAFSTSHGASLQLQCGHDANGHDILTQMWITVLAARLQSFPHPDSLIDAPVNQDTCPASFTIPAWAAATASP